MTDANLILGRLLPEYFPKIFGPNENEPLDYAITRKKFEILQKEINAFLLESGQKKVKPFLESLFRIQQFDITLKFHSMKTCIQPLFFLFLQDAAIN